MVSLEREGRAGGLGMGSTTNVQMSQVSNTDKSENFFVMSFNVRGLNSPYKRSKILDFLRRKKVDIALLQETHLKPDDVNRFQNRNPMVAAADGTRTKGTLILMRRGINLTVEKTGSDNEGRMAFCCTSIQGKKVAFVSLYAPTTFEPDFLPSVTSQLLKLNDYQLYVGSDMNAVIDCNLDKSSSAVSSSQDSASKALNLFISDLNLTDVWRVHNPSVKDYTFFSTRHKTFSRIDYILVSSSLSHLVAIEFLPRHLSDHNPVMSTFHYGGIKKSRFQ